MVWKLTVAKYFSFCFPATKLFSVAAVVLLRRSLDPRPFGHVFEKLGNRNTREMGSGPSSLPQSQKKAVNGDHVIGMVSATTFVSVRECKVTLLQLFSKSGRQGRTASLKQSFATSIHGNVWQVYTQRERLGTGMCGSVYKCEHNQTHAMYAVKTIRRDVLQMRAGSPSKRHSIDTEIDILKTLDHPNVIKLYEVYDDERAIYLVMELCSGGELYDYVNSAQYTERQACNIFHSMVKAINYCHSRGIAHRDLKLENFLFESKEPGAHIKLIDFGLSAKYANVDKHGGSSAAPPSIARMTSLVGTSYYVAPEMISKKGCVVHIASAPVRGSADSPFSLCSQTLL